MRKNICMLIVAALLICFFQSGAYAATSHPNMHVMWQQDYYGSDRFSHIVPTEDGGALLIDVTWEPIENVDGPSNALAIKIDSSGSVQWKSAFGGSGIEHGVSAVSTSDGGYMLLVETDSNDGDIIGNGPTDNWTRSHNTAIIKMDSAGKKQWVKLYGAPVSWPRAILPCADGYLVIGSAPATSGTDVQLGWAMKINERGEVLFDKSYRERGDEIVTCAYPLPDGGALLGGLSFEPGQKTRSCDAWIVRIDAKGETAWSTRVGGNDYDGFFDVTAGADGTFSFCGIRDRGKGWIYGINQNGERVWEYKSAKGYSIEAIQPYDNGYLVAGNAKKGSKTCGYILALDQRAKKKFSMLISNKSADYGINSLVVSKSSGIFVGGYTSYSAKNTKGKTIRSVKGMVWKLG